MNFSAVNYVLERICDADHKSPLLYRPMDSAGRICRAGASGMTDQQKPEAGSKKPGVRIIKMIRYDNIRGEYV
jgi:hypothetical protein